MNDGVSISVVFGGLGSVTRSIEYVSSRSHGRYHMRAVRARVPSKADRSMLPQPRSAQLALTAGLRGGSEERSDAQSNALPQACSNLQESYGLAVTERTNVKGWDFLRHKNYYLGA